MRIAFTMAIRATPISAKTASHSVVIHRHPKSKYAQLLNPESQRNVLPDNPARLLTGTNRSSYFGGLVGLDYDIGRLMAASPLIQLRLRFYMVEGEDKRWLADAVAYKSLFDAGILPFLCAPLCRRAVSRHKPVLLPAFLQS